MTVATASKEVIKSPKLRESRFDDHAQVVALEQRYDLESKPFEEWKSLWTANPAFRRMEEPCEIGWVLEDEFGRVLGYLGNIPLEYEFQGRRILAATTRAWVIDSQYRSLSVLLLNRFFAQPRTELFVNTTVNAAASAAYSIFRALRVPSGKWDQSSFWITNYRGFAKSLLAMKEVFLAEQLSIPASFAFAGVDVFHRGIRRSSRLGLDLVELDHFNSDFDVFWDELRSQNYNKLVAVRDRETLDWHFRFPLQQKRAWIFVARQRSRIVAYAIFHRQDNSSFGLQRMRLVDFQVLDEAYDILLPIMELALLKCRREKIHMLESIGVSSRKQAVLDRLRPRYRRLPSWLYFYKSPDKTSAETLRSSAVWDASLYDGDASL